MQTNLDSFTSPKARAFDRPSEHEATQRWVEPLRSELGRVVIGQHELIDGLLVALLSSGHVLLEGAPGLAKTLAIRSLARAVHGQFARVQFTPDMLPSDIVGTLVYNPHKAEFETRIGPVFTNFLLADEINRAPAKVQSALLEAMQERQVTLGDVSCPLPQPFLVLATQNPIEQEGTYPLPEAQLDRFLFKLKVDYPSVEEERQILGAMASSNPNLSVSRVVSLSDLERSRACVDEIYLDERVARYIVSLIDATRHPGRYGLSLDRLIRYGASPRATIGLALASKARAYLRGRTYVTPQDVKALAPSVLRHRVAVTYEAEAQRIDAEQVVATVLEQLPIP